MTYVPIVVPIPPPTSPRARELADRLAHVLLEFEQTHPSLTNEEVRQATQLALQKRRGGGTLAGPILVGAVGLMVFAGLVAFYLIERGGAASAGASFPMIAVIGLIAVVGALVAVLRRSP